MLMWQGMIPTTQPKDRRPPKVFFSRCALVFMLLKLKKKDKQEKEGDKQGTSHLLAVRETTWLLSQAQVMALGSSFARAAYLPLRC